MKSITLTIILTFCFFADWAQQYVPMPTGKAVWNYRSTWTMSTTPTQHTYKHFLHIQTGEDTTVNNIIYKKIIERPWDTTVTSTTYIPPAGSVIANHPDAFVAGLREDNRKVYIYYKPYPGTGLWVEKLLYDFTASVGDTMPHISFINSPDTQIIVKSIDSIQISGVYRKRYYAERSDGQGLSIIEGMGTDKGLISYLPVPWCYCTFDFHCFDDSTTSVTAATPCAYVWPHDTPNSVSGIAASKKTIVYPVPFSNTLTIDTKDASLAVICNVVGAEVLRQPVNGKSKVQAGHLQPGIYLLKLTDNNGITVHTQRLIKE